LWMSDWFEAATSSGTRVCRLRSSLSWVGPAYGLRPVCWASICSCGLPCARPGTAPGLPLVSTGLGDATGSPEAGPLGSGLLTAEAGALAPGLSGAAALAGAAGFADADTARVEGAIDAGALPEAAVPQPARRIAAARIQGRNDIKRLLLAPAAPAASIV